jgi:hypothetical protein
MISPKDQAELDPVMPTHVGEMVRGLKGLLLLEDDLDANE